MKNVTTSRPGVVLTLDNVRHTPLNRISVAEANAIAEHILVRQADERSSVEVARFGSFI